MAAKRMFAMVAGAVGPVAVIALLFGNQWFRRWSSGLDLDSQGTPALLVRTLEYPSWLLTTGGRPLGGRGLAHIAVLDVTLVLLLVLIAALVFAGARSLDPVKGMVGALIMGWWAVLVAAGVTGVLRGLLMSFVFEFPESMRSMSVWQAVSSGASFALLYGWLSGLGALLAYVLTRPRAARQGGYAGGGQMPGRPAQFGQPGQPGQAMPSAGVQQPGWGAPQAPAGQQGYPASPQNFAPLPHQPPPPHAQPAAAQPTPIEQPAAPSQSPVEQHRSAESGSGEQPEPSERQAADGAIDEPADRATGERAEDSAPADHADAADRPGHAASEAPAGPTTSEPPAEPGPADEHGLRPPQ